MAKAVSAKVWLTRGDTMSTVSTFGNDSSRDPLSLGIDLFWSSWWAVLPVALCAVLAGQLPTAYALWQGLPLPLTTSKDGIWWVLMGVAAIFNLWSWLFIMRRLSGRLTGEGATVLRDSYVAWIAIPRALTVLLLMGGLVALGTLVLVLPGVDLLVVGWLVLPAVATRQGTARQIIDRCLQNARGHWWQLAKGLLLTVIGILALFVIGNLLGLLLLELAVADDTLAGLAGGVLGAIYMPFAAAMAVAHETTLYQKNQSSAKSSL
jgi:hypothetical protein